MTNPHAVTAFLHLPDLPGPAHLMLPLSEAQALDVEALPAFAEAPGAFVPLATSVLVRYSTRRLRLAVFRSGLQGVFLALPYADDPDAVRSQAAALQGRSWSEPIPL